MFSLYHPKSLARELRPLAVTTAVVLLLTSLIACGSNSPETDQAVQTDPAVLVHDDVHANHASDADHASHPEALPAGKLPGTSIYHLSAPWTAASGQAFALTELRGGPAVFVMFYGDCTTACPLLVKAAQDIEGALDEEQRVSTNFVMVSFDTERDTPARLAAYAADKGLDGPNWHWLVGSPLQTRQLATLLGVQYRDAGNGMFAHSNIITVLDGNGVPTARLEGLGIDLEPAVSAIVDAMW